MKKNNKTSIKTKSFTLIELMIIIGIISIITTTILTILKPSEILKNLRDTRRINDLKNIEKYILLLESEHKYGVLPFYGTSSIVYISLPDNSPTCSSWINQLPSLPSGYQYNCVATPTNIDSTGWIPINFSQSSLLNIQKLPIDPINRPPYYYTYVSGGSYELTAALERIEENYKITSLDGGDNDYIYEVGSNKTLTPLAVQMRGILGIFTYKREIYLTSPTYLTDYQTLITLNTQDLISNNKMKNDCSDIRITDSDGSSLLNFWLEPQSCNTENTRIWVKVPEIKQNSTTTLILYYGNSKAPSISNGDNTFELFDDFNGTTLNTNKWSIINSTAGSILISGGEITISSSGDWWGTSDTSLYIISTQAFQYNYIAEARQTGNSFDSHQRAFGLRASSNTNSRMFVFLVDEDATHITHVFRDSDGATASWYGENSGTTKPSFPYKLKFVRINDTVSGYVNDILANTRTISRWDLNYVALTDTNQRTGVNKFDWILVRKYASPEPTVIVGPEKSTFPVF